MKLKISIWTILLIIFTIYLVFYASKYYTLKEEKFIECEQLEDEIITLNLSGSNEVTFDTLLKMSLTEMSLDNWATCRQSYREILTIYELSIPILISVIFLTILSLRFDLLKGKKKLVAKKLI